MPTTNSNQHVPVCRDCEARGHPHIFCHLQDAELDTLSKDRAENHYKKGQVIFYEGNRGHGLYCIYKGKVKIFKMGERGKEQIVRFANTGELLGYRSLLGDEPYNATACALEDCVICHLSKAQFMEVLESNGRMSMRLLKQLSEDVKDSERNLLNITQKTVLERISEALLVLKNKFGLKEDNETLNVILTRRELGDVAGVSTETTIRTISDLCKTGVIGLDKKNIRLTNIGELVQLANLAD